jgi:hypothetical protein
MYELQSEYNNIAHLMRDELSPTLEIVSAGQHGGEASLSLDDDLKKIFDTARSYRLRLQQMRGGEPPQYVKDAIRFSHELIKELQQKDKLQDFKRTVLMKIAYYAIGELREKMGNDINAAFKKAAYELIKSDKKIDEYIKRYNSEPVKPPTKKRVKKKKQQDISLSEMPNTSNYRIY